MFNSRITRRNLIAAATAVALVGGGVTAPAFAAEAGSASDTTASGTKTSEKGKDTETPKAPVKEDSAQTDKGTDQGGQAGEGTETPKTPEADKGMNTGETGENTDKSETAPATDAGKTGEHDGATTDNPEMTPATDGGQNQDGDKDTDQNKAAEIAVYGIKVPATSVVDGSLTDAGKLAVDKAVKENKELGSTFDKVFPVLCGIGKLASTMDKDFSKQYGEKITKSLDGAFGAPKTVEQKVVGAYIVEKFAMDFKNGKCDAEGGLSSDMKDKFAGSSDMKTPLMIVAALAVLAGIANFAMTNPQIAAALHLPGAPMPAPAPAPAK